MSSVAANTALNMTSFAVAAVIGVAVVPLIVGGFGIQALGLVAVSRLVLPSGFAALADLGLPEATVRSVAMRRGRGEAAIAKEELYLSGGLSFLVGVLCGAVLWSCASWITTDFVRLSGERAMVFEDTIRWTAGALVILFPAQIVEACLRGTEHFLPLRLADIAVSIGYGSGVAFLTWSQAGFQWIIYVYLAILALKAVVLALYLLTMSTSRPRLSSRAFDHKAYLAYAFAAYRNKAIGVGIRYAPHLLVTGILGPSSAGIFDALSRVPYLAKSLLGLGTLAVVPAAARLSTASSKDRLLNIAVTASEAFGMIFLPPLVTLAAFSGRALDVWLGPDFVRWAPWFSAFLIWPSAIACYQVMDSVLSYDRRYLNATSLISLFQLVLVVIVGVVMVSLFAEGAFVVGIALAGILGASWRFLLCRQRGLPTAMIFRPARGLLFSILLAAAFAFLVSPRGLALPHSISWNAAILVSALAISWMCYYLVLLNTPAKSLIWQAVRQSLRTFRLVR